MLSTRILQVEKSPTITLKKYVKIIGINLKVSVMNSSGVTSINVLENNYDCQIMNTWDTSQIISVYMWSV